MNIKQMAREIEQQSYEYSEGIQITTQNDEMRMFLHDILAKAWRDGRKAGAQAVLEAARGMAFYATDEEGEGYDQVVDVFDLETMFKEQAK